MAVVDQNTFTMLSDSMEDATLSLKAEGQEVKAEFWYGHVGGSSGTTFSLKFSREDAIQLRDWLDQFLKRG